MAKLATARDSRRYGPSRTRNLWEYINAALYFFATALLVCGFAAQLSGGDRRPGLVAILLGLAVIAASNAHDLLAHMSAIHFLFTLLGFDPQLGFVEFTVPVLYLLGSVLDFIGIFLLLLQDVKGYKYEAQRRAANLLIAGPLIWLLGSVYNGCQVYERADAQCQFLQSSVHIPFLMGSLLFSVGGIFNRYQLFDADDAPLASETPVTESCVWLCIFGSLLFMLGGATNVLKVFRMQQMGGMRLEKLRGGAQERLNRVREERVALIEHEETRGTEVLLRHSLVQHDDS